MTVALAAACLSPSAHAQAANDSLLHRVDDHYNHLASLRCRYVETYAGMGLTRRESGTLLLRKPGRMRWTYDTPAGKLFLLDGKFAWSYTPGDPQVTRLSAKQLDDLRTPLRFLLGHTELKKELENITITPANGDYRIAGIPKGMSTKVKQLTLTVTATGTITAMQLEEQDGATTAFTFTQIEDNAPTAPGDFTFTPPPGVTVINATPPI